MSPNRKEAYYMMQDFNFDGHLRNTKNECLSPESTKSETHSKPFGRQIQKAEENEGFASPSSSSRRLTDVGRIIAPSRRDKQLMRQVSGLDLDDFDKAEAGGAEEGGLIIGGAEVGGIIAPSHRQRQLMRQVSGLGLEDPVFGKNVCLDDSIKEENNFFADMGIDDMPEDMRDMLSLASDRTDVVETDDVQSYDSKSFASVPPLGLEPGVTEEPPSTKKKLRKGKKPRRKSRDMSTTQSVTSDTMYVPPAPAFEPKSKRRGSNDAQRRGSTGSVASYDRALAVDKALAAQVDAILSMNEAKSKGGSNHSRSSFTGHSRTTGVRKGTRPSKPRRQVSAASSTYVPPSVSDRTSQRGERCMPESFDEIFSSSPTIKRVKKKKSSTGEKKKKKKSSSKILRTKDADWVVS